MCIRESGVERGDVRWRQGEICPSFLFPVTNILGEYINIHNVEKICLDCTMQLTFMYNIVLLYMLIFLVADCVCGVVGTSFLVVVGQHEDSCVGSIMRHI